MEAMIPNVALFRKRRRVSTAAREPSMSATVTVKAGCRISSNGSTHRGRSQANRT